MTNRRPDKIGTNFCNPCWGLQDLFPSSQKGAGIHQEMIRALHLCKICFLYLHNMYTHSFKGFNQFVHTIYIHSYRGCYVLLGWLMDIYMLIF